MRLGIVTGLAAEARLARKLGAVRAGGGTPEGAAAAASALLAEGATGLISFGLAGGLDSARRPGSLVVARLVRDGDDDFATDLALSQWLGGGGDALAATRAAVASRADKRALFRRTGAVAVDLESGEVARAAARAGVPFAVLRAVCDPAERDLPPAALMALDSAGVVGFGRVLASLAGRPAQLPALLALARDAARARAALVGRVGDVLARGAFGGGQMG